MAKFKKIDWLNHALEFIVVVIGILLAFQLNTCKEDKKEATLVNKHVESVLEETQFNKGNLEYSHAYSKKMLQQIDSLLTMIDQGEDLQTINKLSLGLMSLDYTYIKKNAYNNLVETGDIRFIKDYELQNDIIGLYEYYAWIEGIDTSARTSYGTQYFPYAVANFNLIEYHPQPLSTYDNKLFKNYLSVYRYSLEYRNQKQKDILELIDEFLIKYKNE